MSTLYSHMKILQWKPFVQLIYTNKNKINIMEKDL
jgi:hypothetical protein